MGTYVPTVGISYSTAISYVKAGGNVFASSSRNAKRLAIAVGNGRSPDWDGPHGGIGYFTHYHATSSRGRRVGGHISYMQW